MLTEQQIQETKDRIILDKSDGSTKIITKDNIRYIIRGDITIPLTSNKDAYEQYYNLIMYPVKTNKNTTINVDDVFKNNKLIIYVGKPDTGKTYKAQELSETLFGKDNVVKLSCGGEMTFTSLLTTVPLNTNIQMNSSKALDFLTDPKQTPCCIIFDEMNLFQTDVLKSLQPLCDTTGKTFTLGDKTYDLNPNCKFIGTMNDKDGGINALPDAIISRAYFVHFTQPTDQTLSKWTNVPLDFVKAVHKVYSELGLLQLYGSRQIKCLYKCDATEINKHLRGICAVKGIEESTIDTPEVQGFITKLDTLR